MHCKYLKKFLIMKTANNLKRLPGRTLMIRQHSIGIQFKNFVNR